MKIAVTTNGRDLDSQIDERFGRAPRFLIYEDETKEFSLVENEQNLNAPQGAGIQSAQTIEKSGAKVLITGNCGPKAFKALQIAGVEIYNVQAMSVRKALDEYANGQLKASNAANVEGHW